MILLLHSVKDSALGEPHTLYSFMSGWGMKGSWLLMDSSLLIFFTIIRAEYNTPRIRHNHRFSKNPTQNPRTLIPE